MSTVVREILDRITQLPDAERLALRPELARQDEQEWKQLSGEAHQAAEQRGIDDEAIVKAAEALG